MLSNQRVFAIHGMIKPNTGVPAIRKVTGIAGLRELAFVKIVVTVSAGGIYGSEVSSSVASSTIDLHMLAVPLKAALSMIEEWNSPPFKTTMATITFAIGKLTRVGIGMTERTRLLRIIFSVCTIRMTTVTGLIRMPTF